MSGRYSPTIDIIDTEKYQRIKQIQCEGYIGGGNSGWSSLRLLNNGTFLYSHEGRFCQISATSYEVLYKDKKEKEFLRWDITSPSNEKYIIANNSNNGISIFKVNYN